ncbi:MAG: hypothetical protein R6V10_08535 [bacterium]
MERKNQKGNKKPDKGSRLLRKGRRSFGHGVYFISAFKNPEAELLDNTACFDSVILTLEKLEEENLLEWFGLVLMPDHFHYDFKAW